MSHERVTDIDQLLLERAVRHVVTVLARRLLRLLSCYTDRLSQSIIAYGSVSHHIEFRHRTATLN